MSNSLRAIEFYSGHTKESLYKRCNELSKDCYVVYWCGFPETTIIYRSDKPIKTKHAPIDYPQGYFHNGRLYEWSTKRKIMAQNAGLTRN